MTSRLVVLLMALFLASGAPAQQTAGHELPALFDVAGVPADDRLNIRAAPTASAPILGTLAPDATMVEVTALNTAGSWGRIGSGERDGWVSLRYLRERPAPGGDIPDGMRCLGTEPFWSLRFRQGMARFELPGEGFSLPVVAAPTRIPPGHRAFGFDGPMPPASRSGPAGDRLSGLIEARSCSDGMSDRSFGWQVVLMRRTAGQMSIETGCCTLDPR